MNIPKHGAANVIAVFPLSYVLSWDWKIVVIFLIAGVAIDIDHLFYFTIKHKTMNPAKWFAIGKGMRKEMKPGLYIFHSPEFILTLLLLSFFNGILFAFFLASLIHILLDIYEHYQHHGNFFWIKKWSIVYSLISND